MPATKEWTLMFYFASDNPLAPSVVSQLKSIKQAGFHPQVNVIAQFDPHTEQTPAHVFDVNLVNKLKAKGRPNIGFNGNDPYVRNLVIDKLWGKEHKGIRDGIRASINEHRSGRKRIPYNPPEPSHTMSGEQDPEIALRKFLEFCRTNYPAHHYMLFILGHGLIVSSDMFLYDEHATKHSLGLNALGRVLKGFTKKVNDDKQKFELIGFSSCSMSSLEVAYELKGTANYMLASQGPAFVGSWPYRQILIRVFNDVVKKPDNVKHTLTRIFRYIVCNSLDFQLAGYSFDLCLSDLSKVEDVKAPIRELTKELIKGLKEKDSLAAELIILAHWEAQSYWEEKYTDLYDFCSRLTYYCSEHLKNSAESTITTIKSIQVACDNVMNVLARNLKEDKLIVRSEFVGPTYQYSHGLSVLFPWSSAAKGDHWSDYEKKYGFKATAWHQFLKEYFSRTMRLSRIDERVDECNPTERTLLARPLRLEQKLLEVVSTLIFNEDGQLGGGKHGSVDATGPGKHGSQDPTGGDCDCPSIKNYPSRTRPRAGGRGNAAVPFSQTLLQDLEIKS